MTTDRALGRAGAIALADDTVGARERILNAAIRYFQQYGYEGTSVSKIATAAGMTPGNLYWHFPSKLDLLAEALQTLYQDAFEIIAKAVGDGTAEERLTSYVRAYVTVQLTELDENCNFGYASLASALGSEQRRELLRAGRPYLDLLHGILEQGRSEKVFAIDEVTVTAFAISTMVEYVFTWYRAEGPLSVDEVGDFYAQLALRMVRA